MNSSAPSSKALIIYSTVFGPDLPPSVQFLFQVLDFSSSRISSCSSSISTYSCSFFPSSFENSQLACFTIVFIWFYYLLFLWKEFISCWLLLLAAFLHISLLISFLFPIHGHVYLLLKCDCVLLFSSLSHVFLSLERQCRVILRAQVLETACVQILAPWLKSCTIWGRFLDPHL